MHAVTCGSCAHRIVQDLKHSRLVLTDEAKPFLSAGTPEAQLFTIIDADGSQLSELKVRLGQNLSTWC